MINYSSSSSPFLYYGYGGSPEDVNIRAKDLASEGEEYSSERKDEPQVAMAVHTFFFSFIVKCYVFLSLFLFYSDQVYGFERRDSTSNSHQLYHTHLELASLLPSSTCTFSEPDPKKVSSLKVVHRHGPCNQHKQDAPTANEILLQDKARVSFIHSRLSSVLRDGYLTLSDNTTVPARSGKDLDSWNYIVTVGLGTPKKELSLVFDTGSDLTWTQCKSCGDCYDQKESIFDPFGSSSYENISCSSPFCSQLQSASDAPIGCDGTSCLYAVIYEDRDESFSLGFYANEKLSLTTSDVVDVHFGCGIRNEGIFGQTAGILGLGRNNISLVHQTAHKYGQVFSYCLPSSSSLTGHLTFGNTSGLAVTYTPLSNVYWGSNVYPLDIEAIRVGGKKLRIPRKVFKAAGSVIDSWTMITQLPPEAYYALTSEFQREMAAYPRAPPLYMFGSCYNLTGYTTVKVPLISFSFKGRVTVEIHPTGILYAASLSQVCLAFTANERPTDVAIIGNMQQKTLEVVYDVAGGRVGFAPGGCA